MQKLILASGFIIRRDNKFLIIKRSEADSFLPGSWELPGGKVEKDEEVEAGLLRELFEECGINVEVLRHVHTKRGTRKKRNLSFKELFYLCQTNIPHKVKLSNEHEKLKWVNFYDIEKFEEKMSVYMKKWNLEI